MSDKNEQLELAGEFPAVTRQEWRALVDGVHIVTSDWLVDRLSIQPRYLTGFQGVGQVPGAVILAANAIATGAADYVVMHRAMFNPPGRYHEG